MTSTATTRPARIDPRGPRFSAAITAVLLLIDVVLALGPVPAAGTGLLAVLVLLFAWGAIAGVRRHPFGLLFATAVRPRLGAPAELEDVRPPTFAQAVGAVITGAGLVLALLGVPLAVPVAAGLAFVAAFLNAVFGLCLGCQLYLLLARAVPAR
jgi:Domain of unknown function (DUF4395)